MKTRKQKKNSMPIAVAVFQTEKVKGEAVAYPTANGVRLTARFTELPSGKHGFHIHKAGDLRGEGCQGACAHYHVGQPISHGDAPPSRHPRHTGDLGNIEMPRTGDFEKTWTIPKTSVRELWGRSLIVHADEDDLGMGPHEDSKTTGHSGARIACAVFGRGLGQC